MHKEEDITSRERLQARIAANQKSSVDFDAWCKSLWPSEIPKGPVLDLGCGTGKQVHLLAPLLAADNDFYACDLAPESLADLQRNYQGKPRLHAIEGSFDQLPTAIASQTFALIYSAYAFYYTQDLPALMAQVHDLLLAGGVFWFIGPAPGNNRAFLDILEQFYPTEAFLHRVSEEFVGEIKVEAAKWGMEMLDEARLENTVSYPSPADFMHYLKNSLYYQAGFDGEIEAALEEAKEVDGSFRVTKSIASLQFRKAANV